MQVLMISTFGTRYIGGGNISAMLTAELLNKNDIPATFKFIRGNSIEDLLDRILLWIPQGIFETWNPIVDLLVRKKVKRLIRQYNPDIVDFQDRYLVKPIAGHKLGNVRKVFTIIDDLSQEKIKNSHSGMKYHLMNMKRKSILRALRKENHIIANSKYTKSQLEKHGIDENNVEVQYRSLPPASWYGNPKPETESDSMSEKKTNEKMLRFLVPGRIAHEKGSDLIPASVNALNKDSLKDKYEVVIIGRGPYKKKLIKEIESKKIDNVIIKDPVPLDVMLDYYYSSDVVLLPYICNEPFGRVALEAMLLGKPVISTMRGGLLETIAMIEGSSLKIDDSNELTEAMRKFILEPELCVEMSNSIIKQHHKLVSTFNHINLIEKYRDYYQQIMISDV